MNNQKLLESLGFTVATAKFTGHTEPHYFLVNTAGVRMTETARGTKAAAWNSIPLDANFCETYLKPKVRGLTREEQVKFSVEIFNLLDGGDELKVSTWLALTPELLCTAYLKFIEQQ